MTVSITGGVSGTPIPQFGDMGRQLAQSADAATVKSALGITTANQLSVFAAGTAYTLTNSSAALDFGTTDPSITINSPGTYLIMATTNLLYSAATFLASRDITLKLRRTNNTAADLANGTHPTVKTSIITTLTFSAPPCIWQTVYTTSNSNDVISIFGDISVVPTAGSIDAVGASIIAIRLQQ